MKMALNVQRTINYYFALNKCQGSRQLHQQQTVLTEKLNYPDIIVKSQWYLCPGKTFFIWQAVTWAKLWQLKVVSRVPMQPWISRTLP